MSYIPRSAEQVLKRFSKGFPIIGILGPRQSGKTTLTRKTFPDKPYRSLENPDHFEFASDDPKGFLGQFPDGAILDECQRVPKIFSYLQGIVDDQKKMAMFVLTGSQQFGLRDQLSQTLAGRIALLTLPPFSMSELAQQQPSHDLFQTMWKGFFPPLYDRDILPTDWFASYVQTYVEKDVHQLLRVKDLRSFQTFIRLCAGRIGQLVNLSGLGNDAGISHVTVKEWLSVLEASFVCFVLKPHYENFAKRLVKSPKLYFFDSGLLCFLLNIKSPEDLITHPLRGQIFENFIVCEYFKSSFSKGQIPDFYFWRDNVGLEIDLLFANKGILEPLEIKSAQTATSAFTHNIRKWQQIAQERGGNGKVVYGGDEDQPRSEIPIYSWRHYEKYLPR